MEQFPNNNNPEENTNQKSTSADILTDMPSFEEMSKQNAKTEDTNGEQDYREDQEWRDHIVESNKGAEQYLNLQTEVLGIKDAKSKYLATALLPFRSGREVTLHLRDREMSISAGLTAEELSLQNNTISIALEYSKSNYSKNELPIEMFTDLMKLQIMASGSNDSRYDNYRADDLYSFDRSAYAKVANEGDEAERLLNRWCKNNGLYPGEASRKGILGKVFSSDTQAQDSFGKYNSQEFLSEPEGWKERPSSDKGIILEMARLEAIKCTDEDESISSSAKQRLDVLKQLYTGKSIKQQLYEATRSNENYIENVKTITQINAEFDERRIAYEDFNENLAKGQQIFDNLQRQAKNKD